MITAAIMQPYFFPYIGYFQLISSVDIFIIYDNVKYTKKGWINRNRILQNGLDTIFSLPLKKDSDFLNISERTLSTDFDREKFLKQIEGNYRRAPYFMQIFPLIQDIVRHKDDNLFHYLFYSIVQTCTHLGITTKIVTSSDISINHEIRGQEKVLALCKAIGASNYVNAIGGTALYSTEVFQMNGLDLKFLKTNILEYPQFENEFVPWLSIIDILMFNSSEKVREILTTGYELVGE